MPGSISRLRRWFAAAIILVVLAVAGTYFYARHRVQNALKQIPEKMGIEIQQTATGFTVSKSEQGRTLFRIQASKAVQFKQGGHAQLHDVEITLYGSDSSRFDQIYGADFDYDQQSGNVVAKGEVQIDLESNPSGSANPDQAPPKELKNPIHLKTSGLVFNQKTGNAYTKERVEFRLPQASGSAVGVNYVAKTNLLTLESEVNVVLSGPAGADLTALRATITRDPHLVLLDHPRLQNGARQAQADQGTLFLRSDNTLDRVLARGNVLIEIAGTSRSEVRCEQAELLMAKARKGAQSSSLSSAILSGDVRAEISGAQPMQANSGRAVLDFSGKNVLTKVHAEENVKLLQHQKAANASASAQDLELTAPVVDFFLAEGRRLQRAETSGPPQIALRSAMPGNAQQTLITAGKFEALFDIKGELSSVHGAPDARIISRNPGQPDRISTSSMLDSEFQAGSGIRSVVQQGSVAYVDGERKAWGDRALYTPADQVLMLTGSPRVVDGGMTSTARSMRLNRITGDAFAEGEVKSTYSDLKPQPGGALLSSSSPIHVTAQAMAVHRSAAVALYTGGARLWQDANIVQAPCIDFDRDHRSMIAYEAVSNGSAPAPSPNVSTVLIQTDKAGNSTPVAIASSRLTYADNERKAHFDGQVVAKGADVTISAQQMDAFLEARGSAAKQSSSTAGKLEKIVAEGQVLVTQPGRHAAGDRLLYTSGEDKFVLTGGPPSIFDAEHGKITGVSLTFFRHDDRVLVEGSNSSPTVTQTRVAR